MNIQTLFYAVIVAWLVLAAITFVVLFFIRAPYGKFTRKGFGPSFNRIAGWIIMETPSVLLMAGFFITGARFSNTAAVIFIIMWQVHYVYRTYVFPFRMRGAKTQMTLVTVLLGVVFNMGNGFMNGYYLFHMSAPYPSGWITDPRFLTGAAIFIIGLGINMHSDSILRSLRKPGETGYKIPQGGMFRYVSSANYLGEIIEWGGWALATWSVPGLVFWIWTMSNLVPRAWSNHKWYREKFPDYPQNRKAVIPLVF